MSKQDKHSKGGKGENENETTPTGNGPVNAGTAAVAAAVSVGAALSGLEHFIQNADEMDAAGLTFDSLISLKEGQGIEGVFMGVTAMIVTGMQEIPKPTRLPVVGIYCTPMNKATGELFPPMVIRMTGSSNLMSQLARARPGDFVSIARPRGEAATVKSRRGYNVKVFMVGVRPNGEAYQVQEGFFSPRVLTAILAEAGEPKALTDQPIPMEAVARVVALEASALKVLPANNAAPALPAAQETTPASA